jgi:TM2 domain-containing membrane protein YozV
MSEQTTRPHAGLAAVFSFIFNGLGQIYNGQIAKGLVIIFISSLSMLVFLAGSIIIGAFLLGKIFSLATLLTGILLFLAGLIFISILGIYSIYDAYFFASRK